MAENHFPSTEGAPARLAVHLATKGACGDLFGGIADRAVTIGKLARMIVEAVASDTEPNTDDATHLALAIADVASAIHFAADIGAEVTDSTPVDTAEGALLSPVEVRSIAAAREARAARRGTSAG